MARLTEFDRFRWIEALVHDEVREKYRQSQEPPTRQQFDARHSPQRVYTIHEALADKWNQDEWIPYSTAFPTLHGDFVEQIRLEKSDVIMTVEKSKYIMSDLKPALTQMIHNYEESGQGSMNRKIDSPEWGRFDISQCDGSDDRSRFLLWSTKTSLLFMWAKLDECNLL